MSRASHAMKLARLVAVVASVAQLGLLAYVFARRVAYPYDLEWMESGTMCHALRVLEGKPIYAAPSVDFVPFLYTPLYPALVALLGKIFGLRYLVARAISVLSFVGACALGYRFAWREGGSRATALVALAIPASTYALTGSWFDLARADSLWLLLSTVALVLVYRSARSPGSPVVAKETRAASNRLRSHGLAALAGVLLVAAFFTKQTAGPLMVAAAAALALLDFRLLPAFVGAMAITGLPSLWWMNQHSGGWFWRYVFELHQGHDFYPQRAFFETPRVLLGLVGPAMILPLWALLRRPNAALAYATWIAIAGIAVACTGFGTQWAFTNAYIPGVFFPSVAIGLGAGQLVGTRLAPAPRLRPIFVYVLLAASALLHRNNLPARQFIPTVADRAAGDRLLARLRSTAGDVLIPFHPFYAYLAGKPTFVHQMGVMDVGRAGLGVPAGLADAIQSQRFSLVIVDDKIFDKWAWWPALRERYRESDRFAGPRVYSGAMTVPNLALVPRLPEPPPAPAAPAGEKPAASPTNPGADPGPIDHEIQ